jgi:hypothetical protein
MAHSRCDAQSCHHGSYRRCYGPNVLLDGGSPPRRGRRGQGDGERVTAQNHERNQPPDGALAVSSSPRNSATYRISAASVSICRLLAVTLARSALRAARSTGRLVSLTREARTGFALAFCRGERKPCARRPRMPAPSHARVSEGVPKTPVSLDGLKSRPGAVRGPARAFSAPEATPTVARRCRRGKGVAERSPGILSAVERLARFQVQG